MSKKREKKSKAIVYDKRVVYSWMQHEGLPLPIAEVEFAKHIEFVDKGGGTRYRKWRFDFAWPMQRVALEVEGLFGRHQRISGFLADMRKYNTATLLGWRVLRVPTRELCMEETAQMLRKLLL